jgi:hypothetical protein
VVPGTRARRENPKLALLSVDSSSTAVHIRSSATILSTLQQYLPRRTREFELNFTPTFDSNPGVQSGKGEVPSV